MRRIVLSLFAFVAGILPAADADFHLYLLIGQSNMAGRGKIELQDKVASMVREGKFKEVKTKSGNATIWVGTTKRDGGEDLDICKDYKPQG